MTALVIVESPTKATKIASFLGDGYIVESSRGHVRDLPAGAADVPAKYKGEPWARTGVNVDADFAPLYVVAPEKKATIRSLKEKLKTVDELYLATDEDREGEAIAWHLLQELKPKVPVKRMVFHEITPEAIQQAVDNPRTLDEDLVDAQETRRILDRLYGYEVSPVLWKKVMPRLSAGRVQSVATRLIVARERERMAFKVAGYADVTATLDAGASAQPPTFTARLLEVGGRRVAGGKDFDAAGALKGKDLIHLDLAAAQAVADRLQGATFTVEQVDSKPSLRRPAAPFRTTTLQQEAGRKLHFGAQTTMSIAQTLYEGGYITYMRTDSIALSGQAINAARSHVERTYGERYLPAKPRVYTSKVKNAQEAHEAIRPAGDTFRTPEQTGLTGDQRRLYELIYQRTIASQMTDAEVLTVTARIAADDCRFTASGTTVTFPGFMRAYSESRDEDDGEQTSRIPKLAQGQELKALELLAEPHETRPPARYTEPTLVAKLEELEIGRPSTYASIIRTITARDYVFKKGSALVPTWLAFAVTNLLESHFATLVDYDFTAHMEETLDEIARGNAERLRVLNEFYFGDDSDGAERGLKEAVADLGDIDARGLSTFRLGEEDEEDPVFVRVGRYGTYVESADGTKKANVEDSLPPDELTLEHARELLTKPMGGERELGTDPQTGATIVAKAGRYGPYVTEVLPEGSKAKPRTGSLFADMEIGTVTLEQALQLMSLPRVVGTDSEGREITAQNGRYGPYLKRGTDSRSLTSESQIFTVTLEEAEAIYAQPKQRGRAAAKPPLAELGTDPTSEKPIVVKEGRFGAYITDGVTNITVPRGRDVASLTHEDAVELLAEKRAKGPAPKKTTRKAPATKAPAKKPAAKKTTTTKKTSS